MHPFSIGDSIKFGWEAVKKRPVLVIGGFFIAELFQVTFQYRVDTGAHPSAAAVFGMFVLIVVSIVIGTLVEIGMTSFALRAHDSVENLELKNLWNPKPFWRYFGNRFLSGLIMLAGFILLIVPGVILGLGLLFGPYLVVDKGLSAIQAMKESWRITEGHKWQIFLFGLALFGLNILGFLALVVGLLVTVPISMIATVHVYRTLEHHASEIVPSA